MKPLLLVLLAIGLLTGCAGSLASPAPALPAPAIQSIDRFIAEEMESRHIPGLALAIVVDGRIRYAKGYGLADRERGEPVRADTPFLVASITKMFTATATMLLVQDGKLRLEAPIGEYLGDLPVPWRAVTPRQLLNHTAGLSSFTAHETAPCGSRPEESEYTQRDVIAEVACLPLDFEPGSDWSYSDTGYFVLGLLIEKISGLAYEEYLRRSIFKPLGMASTRMLGAGDGRATGYSWDGNQLQRGPGLSPVVEGPSGGLISTVGDLAKLDGALARGDLLPPSVLAAMWRPVEVGTARYGLGFGLRPVGGRRQVGHTGGGPAAATSFARFLDDGFTVIVLTNSNQPQGKIQEVVAGVANAWRAQRDSNPQPSDPKSDALSD
jgi:D-alanyl-D-alanine carboxypeptidase